MKLTGSILIGIGLLVVYLSVTGKIETTGSLFGQFLGQQVKQ